VDTSEATPRQPLLVTSSPEQAEAWAAILDDARIGVLIEIADAQTVDPGRSPLIGVLGTRPPEFVHVITIPPEERDRAIAALVEAGWNGREGLPGGGGSVRSSRSARTQASPLRTAMLVIVGSVLAFFALRAIAG